MTQSPIQVIGGGLAGSEASWQLAQRGIPVILYEMRGGGSKTDAHQTDQLAELVCSNSFRSDDAMHNAVGLLHEEMRQLDSLIMQAADQHKIPAGGALAVDRQAFAAEVEAAITNHPLITIKREEVTELPTETAIIATGPLTAPRLTQRIIELTGEEQCAFFDAIAPIITKESIDLSKAWFQSRYDKGEGKDYINCPLNKEQYEQFIEDLLAADKTDFKEWEKSTPYFEGCLPIEVMAERGPETLRFGPMKPVGLTPPSGDKAYAVLQLRQDNKLGTLYNMVGFQTKLKYAGQQQIFRNIPGLEQAEFVRFGGIHRNTFLNSPIVLDEQLRLKKAPNIRIAGQISGVEGYVESAAMGLLAGIFTAEENAALPPETTAFGALLNHITKGAESTTFQPMNVNFGLFPPLTEKTHKKERKVKMAERALSALADWKKTLPQRQAA